MNGIFTTIVTAMSSLECEWVSQDPPRVQLYDGNGRNLTEVLDALHGNVADAAKIVSNRSVSPTSFISTSKLLEVRNFSFIFICNPFLVTFFYNNLSASRFPKLKWLLKRGFMLFIRMKSVVSSANSNRAQQMIWMKCSTLSKSTTAKIQTLRYCTRKSLALHFLKILSFNDF